MDNSTRERVKGEGDEGTAEKEAKERHWRWEEGSKADGAEISMEGRIAKLLVERPNLDAESSLDAKLLGIVVQFVRTVRD